MKTKILIWNTFELLERQGGPSTYLYNLQNSLKKNKKDQDVHFLNEYDNSQEKNISKSPRKKN
ncbi:hypothetical protein, partial [Flavobacterium columnare]